MTDCNHNIDRHGVCEKCGYEECEFCGQEWTWKPRHTCAGIQAQDREERDWEY